MTLKQPIPKHPVLSSNKSFSILVQNIFFFLYIFILSFFFSSEEFLLFLSKAFYSLIIRVIHNDFPNYGIGKMILNPVKNSHVSFLLYPILLDFSYLPTSS